jgi:hypothetical protein
MKDFATIVVPAVAGFGVVRSWLFLVIYHPDQKVPDLMINSVTTIFGYFFGVGVGKSGNVSLVIPTHHLYNWPIKEIGYAVGTFRRPLPQ